MENFIYLSRACCSAPHCAVGKKCCSSPLYFFFPLHFFSLFHYSFLELWNQSRKAHVERTPSRSFGPEICGKGSLELISTLCNHILKTFSNGASTTSLWRLFHWLTLLTVKISFLCQDETSGATSTYCPMCSPGGSLWRESLCPLCVCPLILEDCDEVLTYISVLHREKA